MSRRRCFVQSLLALLLITCRCCRDAAAQPPGSNAISTQSPAPPAGTVSTQATPSSPAASPSEATSPVPASTGPAASSPLPPLPLAPTQARTEGSLSQTPPASPGPTPANVTNTNATLPGVTGGTASSTGPAAAPLDLAANPLWTAKSPKVLRPAGVAAQSDQLNITVTPSPNRPTMDVAAGAWIPGRATFYGASQALEAASVAKGKPAGQYGVLEQGACGFTNSNGALPYPRDIYAAASDTTPDYPGSCGRCYQVRCRSGSPENGGKPLTIPDLEYYDPTLVPDSQGRAWPGNPLEAQGGFYTQCWDEDAVITVRVADSCPCIYYLKTGEVFRQWWCCGGNNHFDLSYWAFEKLAHPTYGVMKLEFRPVDCVTNKPLNPLPGFVNQTMFDGGSPTGLQSGWSWLPYNAKNMELLAPGQGRARGLAICGSLSKGGGIPLTCRECTKLGYQPFAKTKSLQFWIRSNTKSTDPFASSTPPGALPGLKVFLMNTEQELYCAVEVILGENALPKARDGDWYGFTIPLSTFGCDARSSAGSLANVDKVDFQNVNERDAEVCLDGVALVA